MVPSKSEMSLRILDVADRIYAAALDPTCWSDALAGMRDLVGGTVACLRVESFEPVSSRQIWLGIEPAFQKAYVDQYWRDDVCSSLWPIGTTHTADVLVPKEIRKGSAFYNELCVPFELDDLVGGRVEATPSGWIALSILRGGTRHRFDATHTALLDALVPHLRRALRINDALDGATDARATTWSAFDRMPVGLFAIDRFGHVKQMNRAGENMLGRGLRLGRDGVAAMNAKTTRALRALLASSRTRRGSPVALALPRPTGLPLSAIVLAPGRETLRSLGRASSDVLLVVTDPNARVEPPASVLVRVYGLTAAEARVALLLGRGLVPKEVASELGTSWNTVRTQLRQIYAKTQTSGQAGLARLLTLMGFIEG